MWCAQGRLLRDLPGRAELMVAEVKAGQSGPH